MEGFQKASGRSGLTKEGAAGGKGEQREGGGVDILLSNQRARTTVRPRWGKDIVYVLERPERANSRPGLNQKDP